MQYIAGEVVNETSKIFTQKKQAAEMIGERDQGLASLIFTA